MNAVEIEEAITALAAQPFDAEAFPYLFLEAFGNKATTIRRLRKGESNRSDLGGVLQTGNIHIAVAAPGAVTSTLGRLKASPATARARAKFVLATDGDTVEAEDLASGETVACAYADIPDHFGFFLPLSGLGYLRHIAAWRAQGYRTSLFFLALPNVETAIARVATRVRQGGHDIPEPVIRRRFDAGWNNFHRRYKQAVDDWALYDNAGAEPVMLEWGENR